MVATRIISKQTIPNPIRSIYRNRNVQQCDFRGRSSQAVAAARASSGFNDPRIRQFLKDLRQIGRRHMRTFGDFSDETIGTASLPIQTGKRAHRIAHPLR